VLKSFSREAFFIMSFFSDLSYWSRIAAEYKINGKQVLIFKKIRELVLIGTYSEKYEAAYQPSYRSGDEDLYKHKLDAAYKSDLHFQRENVSLATLIKTKPDTRGIDYRIAIAIRENDREVIELVREAIMGDGEITLTQQIIIGVIKSGYMPLLQDLGRLLLAAKGQEGVRQSIIEWCDSGSPATQAYFMKLCVDNNLMRFSSVARALGCFSGVLVADMRPAALNKLFTLLYENLINPKPDFESGGDVTEIYAGLWGAGANDMLTAKEAALKVVDSLEKYKRLAGWYFLSSVNDNYFVYDIAIDRIDRPDPEEQALTTGLINIYSTALNFHKVKGIAKEPLRADRIPVFPDDFKERKRQFNALGNAVKRIGEKTRTFNNCVFEGNTVKLSSMSIARTMMSIICYDLSEDLIYDFEQYLPFISGDLRGKYYRVFLKPEAKKDRAILLRGLSDKSVYIKKEIVSILGYTEFQKSDIDYLIDVLTTVNSDLRKAVVTLLSNQDDEIIKSVSDRLTSCKNDRQREAGEELREYITPKPLEEFTRENGYGLIDRLLSYQNELKTARENLPQITIFTRKELRKMFFPDFSDVLKLINDLEIICNSHKGEEVTCCWDNGKVTKEIYKGVSIDNYIYVRFLLWPKNTNDKALLSTYHFGDEFLDCFIKSGIPAEKIELINTNLLHYCFGPEHYTDEIDTDFDDLLYSKTPDNISKKFFTGNLFNALIAEIEKDDENRMLSFDFCLSVWMSLIKLIREDEYAISNIRQNVSIYMSMYTELPMISFPLIEKWRKAARRKIKTDEQFKIYWSFIWFLYLATGKKYLQAIDNDIMYSCRCGYSDDLLRAHSQRLLSDDELTEFLMESRYGGRIIYYYTDNKNRFKEAIEADPGLKEPFDKMIENIVRIEEKRGDLETPVTDVANAIRYFEGGVSHFAALVKALEKEKLYRGYGMRFIEKGASKQQSLSTLLKACYPKQSDDENALKAELLRLKIPEKQVLRAIMYAPQWAGLAEKALGINGLKSAVWLFHAHVNDVRSAEKETEIALFSPISMQEFSDGTFDKDWFLSAYNAVGDKVFGELYKNALYITESSSNKHRRSQIYTDAVLGRFDKSALEAEIESKRGQEKLRAYGLIPLDKNDSEDAINRYKFIQKFIKESKKFGAQRRESEKKAARIALQNLAITTGFSDADRMTWNFESEMTELTGKELREQKSRAKTLLENAMTARTVFYSIEIIKLLGNTVLSEILCNLVFISDDICGFPKAVDGKLFIGETPVSGELFIAHPVDFLRQGNWAIWQKFVFENKIIQPFKQVFREYYPITEDEIEAGYQSNRYAGHQVQPKKAAALLKARGWTVDYEEGLQKVFHKENLIVRMYAAADWFTPADIEAPVIEGIEFTYRDSGKRATLSDIPPILFSETMRDIDLVVSVAHIGGVDPEASASTVEMRIAIATELLSLLKIKNVTFKSANALIKGKFGEYSVHLGSGTVHQMGVGMLPVLAVHSGQRGRIFLPFADSDPRTAEIISKILLFADDSKIKDPAILGYRKN
jgi:hypothetical protein